jgi:formate-dependent nitrite reductase membrane component NrfD
MDSDLMLVIGIILAVLVIPSLLNAFTEGRAPRMAAIVVLISGTLITVAVTQRGGGYTLDEVPAVFGRVFSRLAR